MLTIAEKFWVKKKRNPVTIQEWKYVPFAYCVRVQRRIYIHAKFIIFTIRFPSHMFYCYRTCIFIYFTVYILRASRILSHFSIVWTPKTLNFIDDETADTLFMLMLWFMFSAVNSVRVANLLLRDSQIYRFKFKLQLLRVLIDEENSMSYNIYSDPITSKFRSLNLTLKSYQNSKVKQNPSPVLDKI